MSLINPYKPKPFSFTFRDKSSRDFGLYVNSYDFLLPEKRRRKIEVPFMQGAYDFGEDGIRLYNERELRLRCIWVRETKKGITRADIREISYWLSRKGRIVLDIEPDKYYIGELFDANQLIVNYDYMIDMLVDGDGGGTTDGEFELNFICSPFAYGKTVRQPITQGVNNIKYEGTAETPTTIILKNETTSNIINVQIVVNRRTN